MRVAGGEVMAGVKGREGTERLRDIDPEANEVAAVEAEGDRDSEILPLVETEELDRFDRRGVLLARCSNDAFFVCEGALLGMTGGSLSIVGNFWPGTAK